MKLLAIFPLLTALVAGKINFKVDPRTYSKSTGCNMDPRYCQLRYDQYTHPATHDSAANRLGLDCNTAKNAVEQKICQDAAHLIPKPIYDCFWNTQPDHDLIHQLNDGIRSFDLRGCQEGQKAVFCHGDGKQRATGISLEAGFGQIRQFLTQFQREVITINIQFESGDFNVVRNQFIANVGNFLGEFLHTPADNTVWPTLGEMVRTNKRVVVFARWDEPKGAVTPPWMRLDDTKLMYRTWTFSQFINNSQQLKQAMLNFCQNPPAEALNKWQALEYTIPTAWGAIEAELKGHHKPEVCLKQFSDDENKWMMSVAQACYPKFAFFHRVMVDSYFKSPVFDVVEWMNELNLAKLQHPA